MDLPAPRHVGSSWTRDRTRVPSIGRRILNHCTTREVPKSYIFKFCIILKIKGNKLSHVLYTYNIYVYLTYLVGSLVSESISRSSSLDKKKNLGKKRRFFSRYSLSPLRMSSKSSLDFFSLSSILSIVTTARTCLS